MEKETKECDLLTEGFQERVSQELPKSAKHMQIHIFSKEDQDDKDVWTPEIGTDIEAEEWCYLCKTCIRSVPDSRTGNWRKKRHVLGKIYMSEELRGKIDTENTLPLSKTMEIVLEKIITRITNCKMFEDLLNGDRDVCDYLLEEINDVNSFVRKYVKGILEEKKLPDTNIISQLSAQMYERRPIHGRIYFMEAEIWNSICKNPGIQILDLQQVKQEQREFKMENMRGIRKFLEMTGEDTCLLATVEDEPVIRAIVPQKDVCMEGAAWLEFAGHLNWKLCSDEILWIGYRNGKPYLKIEEDLGGEYKEKVLNLQLKEEGRILEIINLLKREEHGTSIVFMDANMVKNEVDRLHMNNRCIKLEKEGIDLAGYLKEMPEITAIDGALLADTNGKCYAIGAILDGIVERPGKVERGARYNSVVNYVHIKKEEKPDSIIFGVIVSEDKSVDIEIP